MAFRLIGDEPRVTIDLSDPLNPIVVTVDPPTFELERVADDEACAMCGSAGCRCVNHDEYGVIKVVHPHYVRTTVETGEQIGVHQDDLALYEEIP